MIVVSVTYPKFADKRFDLDYYVNVHMPMVRTLWKDMGMGNARVLHGMAGVDGGEPTVEVMCLVEFESVEALDRALKAHGAEILGDVPNFTDIEPTLHVNAVAL